ncbi:MAG: lycopene cyclase domain-containing protein [Marinoscillum sp.]
MKWLYLILNVFTISFPLIRSFEPKIQFATKWKFLFPAILITGTFFITWDVFFTKAGVWGFNPDYLTGIYLLELPIEEWLFFLTVPFASIFIYECVKYFLPDTPTTQAIRWGTLGLALALVTIAAFNYTRSYTFWNFLFASALLILTSIRNPEWLGHFWISYAFHLIPFLIVNGVLTGSFIEEPIVWYNNTENLKIRLFTIPIEDTIYSLLLFLMIATLYEKFRSIKKSPM